MSVGVPHSLPLQVEVQVQVEVEVEVEGQVQVEVQVQVQVHDTTENCTLNYVPGPCCKMTFSFK